MSCLPDFDYHLRHQADPAYHYHDARPMRIRTSPLISAISGKIGNPRRYWVYVRKGISQIYPRRSSKLPRKQYKGAAWLWAQHLYQTLDILWTNMPDPQQAPWRQQAKWFRPHSNSGWAYFVHVNFNRALVGWTLLPWPPERPHSVKRRIVTGENWPEGDKAGKFIPVWESGILKDPDATPFDPEEPGDPPPDPPPYPPPDPEPGPTPCLCPVGLADFWHMEAIDIGTLIPCGFCEASAEPQWPGNFGFPGTVICWWAANHTGYSINGKDIFGGYLTLTDIPPCHWYLELTCTSGPPFWWLCEIWTGKKFLGSTPAGQYHGTGSFGGPSTIWIAEGLAP